MWHECRRCGRRLEALPTMRAWCKCGGAMQTAAPERALTLDLQPAGAEAAAAKPPQPEQQSVSGLSQLSLFGVGGDDSC